MMERTLSAVADAVAGHLHGADAPFGRVSTDTRSIGAGSLFVALRGQRFDGHDFVEAAGHKGAVGAIVSRLTDAALSQIEVSDTLTALGSMARAWRRNFSIPTVAITGSSGKTTVKELTAAILRVSRQVCLTEGNLNNEIGVPLTLMRVDQHDEALVVELGANHAGEIAYLSALTEPTVGVITNAGAAHLEGFGSLQGVADAKGELLEQLPADGAAVLCTDDRFWSEWRARSKARTVVGFGFDQQADCTVIGEPTMTSDGSRFTMRLPDTRSVDIELPLLGRHNVLNALAASAAAYAVGVSLDDIRIGLAGATAVSGRFNRLQGSSGARVIDDSYNANPTSVRAAVDYLAGLPGRRVLVLGDMAELGEDARALHREIGSYSAGKLDALVTIGALAEAAAVEFGKQGHACGDINEALSVLQCYAGDETTILVKGSRIMGLELLVDRLTGRYSGGEQQC